METILKTMIIAAAVLFPAASSSAGEGGESASSQAAALAPDAPQPKGGVYARARWSANARAELPAAPQLPMQKKKWTVMAFINGSNNLGEFVLRSDLQQMSSVGTTDNMNLVVDLGLSSGKSMSLVQRMLLLPPKPGKKINTVVYSAEINRDMGAWANAADFVQWAKKNFPAERYLFIIQNHGGMRNGMSGISFDDTAGSFIKAPQLSPLFKRAGKVDIFVLAACLMQTAEVAYQVGEAADVIIGSEEVDWSDLFQHKERFAYLNAHPGDSTEDIAAAFVNMRQERMVGDREKRYNTLSAVRTAELKGLPAALNAWTDAVMNAKEPFALLQTVSDAARFESNIPRHSVYVNSQLVDLGDFTGAVAKLSKNDGVKTAAGGIARLLQKAVIANSAVGTNTEGVDYAKRVHGLSIRMLPLAPRSPGLFAAETAAPKEKLAVPRVEYSYRDFQLMKDGCKWADFLEWTKKLYVSYQMIETKY